MRSPDTDTERDARRLGDRLVAVGASIFAVGLLASLVTLVPLFLDSERLPTVVYLGSVLAPVGLATAIAGVIVLSRSGRRR